MYILLVHNLHAHAKLSWTSLRYSFAPAATYMIAASAQTPESLNRCASHKLSQHPFGSKQTNTIPGEASACPSNSISGSGEASA